MTPVLARRAYASAAGPAFFGLCAMMMGPLHLKPCHHLQYGAFGLGIDIVR
jgi:hypothetical protein